MTRSALIGCTGFVGTALQRQRAYDGLFNSRNVTEIAGESFDLVVCAAAPATMWLANKAPAEDKANLDALKAHLSAMRAERFVLISTIAVLDDPAVGYTENTACYESAKAYGRHRRELEEFALDHFPQCYVLRLPALFGEGLKKNFLFDLINPLPSFLSPDAFAELREELDPPAREALAQWYRADEGTGMVALDRAGLGRGADRDTLERAFAKQDRTARYFTNSASEFQYYNLMRLDADIDRTLAAGIEVLHMCSEPLAAGRIARALTGEDYVNDGPPIYREDMRTGHSTAFGGPAPYLIGADEVLADLKLFHATATDGERQTP